MTCSPRRALLLALAFAVSTFPLAAQSAPYRYFRVGNPASASATPRAGFALMGGGKDLDEAFRFLCDRSGGGDFLVLRSHGDDDYNPWIKKLCHLNSVATLIVPSRAAAADPVVAEKIRSASALFIAGGDQGEYVTFWKNTPMQDELNRSIARGVPIGGTSAGLAVLGQYIYTSAADKPDDPNLDAATALADPFGPRIALDQDLLDIPLLKNIVTDTHFARRNRMGRLLVFLARFNQPDGKPLPPPGLNIRGIGVEERAAVLLESTGEARVVGRGHAYFIDPAKAAGSPQPKTPLTFGPYGIQKVAVGHSFNLKTWSGEATHYTLSVQAGQVSSTQPGGSQY